MDTPVKRYSSGMYVRLAFAVAAHLEPEILIVDEVLAVGDASFQKKCLGKMKEVSGKGGRTVLFVSHNMHAVTSLTKKCAFLKGGRIEKIGLSDQVIASYLKDNVKVGAHYEGSPNPNQASVQKIRIITSKPGSVQESGEPMKIEFEIFLPEAREGRTFSFQIVDSLDRPVVHIWRYDQDKPFLRGKGLQKVVCEIPKCLS